MAMRLLTLLHSHLAAKGLLLNHITTSSELCSNASLQVKLPVRLQPLRLPLVGEFAAQDSLIAERTLEAGTPYVMDIEDAEIYRCAEVAAPHLATHRLGEPLMAHSFSHLRCHACQAVYPTGPAM